MRNLFPGLVAGVLFGAGLTLSDMVDPARVQAFLDIGGAWDPTLLFVMAAAMVPSAIAYLVRRRMTRPALGDSFSIPANRELDRRLLTGAALFGVGWGLVGFCPGPAIAGLALGAWQTWLFVASMIAGMAMHHFFAADRSPAAWYQRRT